MELLLVIFQAVGLATAAGIRPFLPLLLTATLARLEIGIDLGGTDFIFIQQTWFMLLVVVLLILYLVAQRMRGAEEIEAGPLGAATAGIAIASGGLLAAASFDDYGSAWLLMLPLGLAVATVSQVAVRNLLARTRKRLDQAAQNALTVYADSLSIGVAALALLLPPASLVAFIGVVALLVTARKGSDEKYAGLRILR